MMNVITLTVPGEMSFAERASIAGVVALQGILTIFVVLALLWGTIELMHCALHRKKKISQKAVSPKNAPDPVQTEEAFVASAPQAVANDGEIVAAITAAISAMLADEGYTGGFRVVSFKRREPAKTKNL